MKPKEARFTAEWLRANLHYEPSDGSFWWKVRKQGRVVGKVLGTTVWPGYQVIKVEQIVYYAHRLAWLYVYGVWPDGSIDHIDGNKANNAISNLRVATPAQNAAGRPTRRRIAPSRGVVPQGSGFVARIHYGGKRHYLGYFKTKEAAQAAYEKKATEIHGEFAFKERSVIPRDFLNAVQCEVCGSKDDLELHTSRLGVPRGKLCRSCLAVVQHAKCNSNTLHKAADYVDRLNIPDD